MFPDLSILNNSNSIQSLNQNFSEVPVLTGEQQLNTVRFMRKQPGTFDVYTRLQERNKGELKYLDDWRKYSSKNLQLDTIGESTFQQQNMHRSPFSPSEQQSTYDNNSVLP